MSTKEQMEEYLAKRYPGPSTGTRQPKDEKPKDVAERVIQQRYGRTRKEQDGDEN